MNYSSYITSTIYNLLTFLDVFDYSFERISTVTCSPNIVKTDNYTTRLTIQPLG